MDIGEIHPGMKGFGLTVLKGTTVDTFDIEIVDIMENALPKSDLILARISGFNVDNIGIAEGMSGSPVYIRDKNNDTRLVGALAYNFTMFPKDSGYYVGVTPIGNMVNPPNGMQTSSSGSGDAGNKESSDILSPIKLPLNIPGVYEEALNELKNNFPNVSILEGNASLKSKPDSLLPVPGLTLAIPLIDGDITYAVLGTCTYVDGEKVWAFGHSFNNLGETELPMSAGYIYSTIPSNYFSYKLGIPMKTIGSISRDNITGIYGVIGKIPGTIKTEVIINSNKFHYKLARDERLLPLLFTIATINSIYGGFKFTGDVTMSAAMNIKAGENKFEYENTYTGNINFISRELNEVFNLICKNPFQKIEVEDISVNLSFSDTVKFAKISGLWADKSKIEKGDTLSAVILLTTYQGGIVKKEISIKTPQCLDKGDLWLSVESGKAVSIKSVPRITTLTSLKRWLSESPANNELVIKLSQKGRKSQLLGDEFQALPPSIESFFEESPEGKVVILDKKASTDWILTGEGMIKLEVK